MVKRSAKVERRVLKERLSGSAGVAEDVQGRLRPDITVMLGSRSEEKSIVTDLFDGCVGSSSSLGPRISLMELGLCEVETERCLEDKLRRAGITLEAIYSLNDSSLDKARGIDLVRSKVQNYIGFMEGKLSKRRHSKRVCQEERDSCWNCSSVGCVRRSIDGVGCDG